MFLFLRYVVLEEQEIAVPMQKISQSKLEKTLEAQVQDGDTLQALALRFHCTVSKTNFYIYHQYNQIGYFTYINTFLGS